MSDQAGKIGRVPLAELARIDRDKVEGYLLNSNHPAGGPKAAYFLSRGFPQSNPHQFAESLRQHIANNPAVGPLPTLYGAMSEVTGPMPCPDGQAALIRSVWIFDANNDTPRLVTAYPA